MHMTFEAAALILFVWMIMAIAPIVNALWIGWF